MALKTMFLMPKDLISLSGAVPEWLAFILIHFATASYANFSIFVIDSSYAVLTSVSSSEMRLL